MRRTIFGAATGLALAVILSSGAHAQTWGDTDPGRRLLRLADGETDQLLGVTYRAHGPVQAVVVLSSEFATVAVIDGRLDGGGQVAGAGEALVTPVERGRTRRFVYDAERLRLTLNPEWLATAGEPLQRVAERQRRARFWGRLEPVEVNATAPVSPVLENVRAGYLANEAVAQLRRDSQGDRQRLAALTAARFARALAGGDAAVVAALIDPQPFTDTGATPPEWQGARMDLARRLTSDRALVQAMGATPEPDAAQPDSFLVGRYRMTLVARDRAVFVASLEPQS